MAVSWAGRRSAAEIQRWRIEVAEQRRSHLSHGVRSAARLIARFGAWSVHARKVLDGHHVYPRNVLGPDSPPQRQRAQNGQEIARIKQPAIGSGEAPIAKSLARVL